MHIETDFCSRTLQSKSLCQKADIVQITGKLIDKTFLIAKPINPNPFFGKKRAERCKCVHFQKEEKKNLRPHDTIKMVCNIHNGALLLCPAKLSRHKPQAGGWRSQKSAAHARERLKHGRRQPVRSQYRGQPLPRSWRQVRTHAFSHLALFSSLSRQFLQCKSSCCCYPARATGWAIGRARAALALLQRRVVQNQRQPDALFGNAFKSSYVCMYSVQGVSLKNAFSATVGWLCCAEGCYFWCAHYQKMVKLVSQRTFY